MMKLEICAGNLMSARAAIAGGADRLELCCSLETGGLTPSMGLLHAVRRLTALPLHVLIRERNGDFLYDDAEKAVMLDDIRRAANAGADGVVVGGLTAEGRIDTHFAMACRQAAGGLSLTFHRAFDLAAQPHEALEMLVDCGCDRVLTSGQAATAEAGIGLLRQLHVQAQGRIIVLPGCGVNARNARRILLETGCRELHASAKTMAESRMSYRRSGAQMGTAEADDYHWMATCAEKVREIKHMMNKQVSDWFSKD